MPRKTAVRAEGAYGHDFERRDFARNARRHNDRALIAEALDELDEEDTHADEIRDALMGHP